MVPVPPRAAGDERLAAMVAAGSDAAFAELFRRYHQLLYRYCRSLVRSDHDAQDALQTTFTNALLALRAGRRDAPLRPWLMRIAHNESISLLRKRRLDAEPTVELESTHAAHDTADERERVAMLLADLRELPERQRGALVMRELSGLSHAEIGVALGVSATAAKHTILEARRSLMEMAEGRSMQCEEVQRIISDGDRRMLRSRRVRAHLRDCSVCSAFAEAIPERRAEMLVLWPILPAAAATGVFTSIGVGTAHGAVGAAATGIGAKVGAADLATKAFAATAVVAAAGATAGGLVLASQSGPRPHRPAHTTVAYHPRPTAPPPKPPGRAPAAHVKHTSPPARRHHRAAAVRTYKPPAVTSTVAAPSVVAAAPAPPPAVAPAVAPAPAVRAAAPHAVTHQRAATNLPKPTVHRTAAISRPPARPAPAAPTPAAPTPPAQMPVTRTQPVPVTKTSSPTPVPVRHAPVTTTPRTSSTPATPTPTPTPAPTPTPTTTTPVQPTTTAVQPTTTAVQPTPAPVQTSTAPAQTQTATTPSTTTTAPPTPTGTTTSPPPPPPPGPPPGRPPRGWPGMGLHKGWGHNGP